MPTTKKKAKKTTKKTKTTKAKKSAPATKAKAPKKKVSKSAKASSKKSSPKKEKVGGNEKVLVCAAGQKCFWTTDGQVLHDLQELSAALDKMAQEVYEYHVNKERNDFADWVESVLKDASCAEALRRSKKPSSARTVVVRHLKYYTL